MEKLIDIGSYPVVNVLDLLLQDKSTKKNIIWATDTYEELGEDFTDKAQMNAHSLLRRPDLIRPRIQKSQEAQEQRTRKKAEVFTPAWLCNQMNNYCDDDWFGRSGVFNTENADHTWTISEGKIEFPKEKPWQQYVDSRRLEITCGEAPYLVSRYDVSTGELIVPLLRRIGILDRKLRIVGENADTYEEWLKWAVRAFEASYGYEYQGDNVLIARINLLLTFVDYYEERWERKPDDKLLRRAGDSRTAQSSLATPADACTVLEVSDRKGVTATPPPVFRLIDSVGGSPGRFGNDPEDSVLQDGSGMGRMRTLSRKRSSVPDSVTRL